MLKFDEAVLKKRLNNLDADKRSIFAFNVARRLLQEASGDTVTLEEVILSLQEGSDLADEDHISAAIYALRSYAHKYNVQDVIFTARRAYEYADAKAQSELNTDFDDEGAEEKLQGSEIVQEELQAQEDVLAGLEAH